MSARVLGLSALTAGLLLMGGAVFAAPLVLANSSNNDGNPHVCDNPSNAHGAHDDKGDPGASGTKGNGNGKDCPITVSTPTPAATPTPTPSSSVSGTSTSSAAGVSAASASNPTLAVVKTPSTGADVSFGTGGLLTLAGLALLGVGARRRRT